MIIIYTGRMFKAFEFFCVILLRTSTVTHSYLKTFRTAVGIRISDLLGLCTPAKAVAVFLCFSFILCVVRNAHF